MLVYKLLPKLMAVIDNPSKYFSRKKPSPISLDNSTWFYNIPYVDPDCRKPMMYLSVRNHCAESLARIVGKGAKILSTFYLGLKLRQYYIYTHESISLLYVEKIPLEQCFKYITTDFQLLSFFFHLFVVYS